MPRILLACLAGFLFLLLYLVAVLRIADLVLGLHWALQVPFFMLAGFVWVFPIRALMIWAARPQR
ncbi:hypothetical protein CR162_04760 [Pseudoroseomonas rhizosphaerae]|uniref:DUF2842 domain-containing protein n=1 Tax=Teichococcus rhizosphaerae TaxID=1335062 RepID=A0A2C6ZCD1_9PROT|nr:DUF2842 domain-containing protein [Pseudoroseomonas rhizosphaerae]PHK96151.1 hypothetical protein CR162_04760 [Pseudoroseomonas rhizosphaerae]